MAQTFETPNMHMDLPVVQGEVGPLWAQELNTAIGEVIDAHDHTSGNGVQVPTAGILINEDLPMNDLRVTEAGGVAFTDINQPSALSAPDQVYVSGGELYFQDGDGNNVQLTDGGGIVPNGTGAANGFYGEYATAGAHAYYYGAGGTFQFYTDATAIASATRAGIVAAGVSSVVAGINDFYLGTGGGERGSTLDPVTGGWRLRSTDTYLSLASDPTAAGSYGDVVTIQPLSGGRDGYAFGVNDSYDSFSFTVAEKVTVAAVAGTAMLRVDATGVAYPRNGVGASLFFEDKENAKVIGGIYGYYKTQADANTGAGAVRLGAAYNGSVNGTDYLEIANFSGGVAVGIMGAAVAGQGTTVYSNLVPNTTGRLLGTGALPWGTVTAEIGTFASNLVAGNTLEVFNTSNFTGTMTTRNIVPSSTTRDLGSSAAYWGNFYTANTKYRSGANTQTQDYSGIVHHAVSVSSDGSKVYEFSANNTCTVTKTGGAGTGTYDLDFSQPLPATQCLFFGSIADNGGYSIPAGVQVSQASTTKLQVSTFNGGSSADLRFNVMILSTGF